MVLFPEEQVRGEALTLLVAQLYLPENLAPDQLKANVC